MRKGLGDCPRPTIGLPLAIGCTGGTQVRVERLQRGEGGTARQKVAPGIANPMFHTTFFVAFARGAEAVSNK